MAVMVPQSAPLPVYRTSNPNEKEAAAIMETLQSFTFEEWALNYSGPAWRNLTDRTYPVANVITPYSLSGSGQSLIKLLLNIWPGQDSSGNNIWTAFGFYVTSTELTNPDMLTPLLIDDTIRVTLPSGDIAYHYPAQLLPLSEKGIAANPPINGRDDQKITRSSITGWYTRFTRTENDVTEQHVVQFNPYIRAPYATKPSVYTSARLMPGDDEDIDALIIEPPSDDTEYLIVPDATAQKDGG